MLEVFKNKDHIPMMELPMCAVCGRQVDSMERTFNTNTMTTVFTFRCHGEQETIALHSKKYLDSLNVSLGMVFKKENEEDVEF